MIYRRYSDDSLTPSPSPTPGTATALQSDFVSVVSKVSPSVVVIETSTGLGSGIIFDTKGDILTNDQVRDVYLGKQAA